VSSGGFIADAGRVSDAEVGGKRSIPPDQLFERDPGGCACNVPGANGTRRGALALGLLGMATAVLRRKSRRTKRSEVR
jgi:MYXO-CTERM domain-containing protein